MVTRHDAESGLSQDPVTRISHCFTQKMIGWVHLEPPQNETSGSGLRLLPCIVLTAVPFRPLQYALEMAQLPSR